MKKLLFIVPSADDTMTTEEKIIMVVLIKAYKKIPFLWDKSHHCYYNRMLRWNWYKKLLNKYQEIDKDATLPIFKRKFDKMRLNYMRELRKVRESRKIASDPGSVYSPKLWYYDLFSFLENHVPETELKMQNSDNNSNIRPQFVYYDERAEGSLPNSELQSMSAEYLEENGIESDDCEEVPLKMEEIKEEPCDTPEVPSLKNEDWEVIRKAIGIQLRDITPHQAAISQKLISDALFYAKLGRLTEESTICLNSR